MKSITKIILLFVLASMIQVTILRAQARRGGLENTEVTQDVTITGTVSGDTKGFNKIYYSKSGKTDSATIVEGQFKFIVPYAQQPFTLVLWDEYGGKINHFMSPYPILITESGRLNIKMDIENGFHNAVISGLNETIVYSLYTNMKDKVSSKYYADVKKMKADLGSTASEESKVLLKSKTDSLFRVTISAFMSSFIKAHSNSFASLYALNERKKSLNDLKTILSYLSPNLQNTEMGKSVLEFANALDNKILDGDQLKNFSLVDDKGKEFSFDHFKGKYVWIDFWASWCVPCKMLFPSMRKTLIRYKDENFEILSISTDQDKAAWLKAVHELNNPWTQLWDNKTIATQFSVGPIPASFLIGPDGKILLSETGFDPDKGSKIDKKLMEIFGAK